MNKTIALAHKEKISVMRDVIVAIESLQLLETIFGFAPDIGFRIVGIADTLSGDQRDSIWDINWEFQKSIHTLTLKSSYFNAAVAPLPKCSAKAIPL